MIKYGLILFLLWSQGVVASMESSYQEGGSYAGHLQEQAKTSLPKTNVQEIPRFQSDNPKESALYKNNNLESAAQQSLKENEAGQTLIETSKNRQRFEINPTTDPLFQVEKETTAETVLNIKNEPKENQNQGFIQKTCEEGGEEMTHECFENRHVVPTVPIKSMTMSVNHLDFTNNMVKKTRRTKKGKWYRHAEYEDYTEQEGWTVTLPKEISAFRAVFCPKFQANNPTAKSTRKKRFSFLLRNWNIPLQNETAQTETKNPINIDCSRIKSYKINSGSVSEGTDTTTIITSDKSLNITLNHDTYEGEEIDEWQSNCDSLEKMVDEGLCQYGERVLSQGPETRNIKGYQIKKDAWQYKQVYHCKMIKDDCAPLRSKGCYQIGSKCKEKKGERCWIYEQTYQCPEGKLSRQKTQSPALEAFCLTGDCHNTSYQANGEMLEVISRLSLLKEIQDDIKTQGSNFQIFKGKQHQCTRNCLNFKDCCGGLKGWGVSLHIAGCTAEEKALSQLREQNLCHQIGTYCAKKVLKKCVSKKTGFCCFGSKFAKLLQEQGRAQLKVGWGTAECPDCRGLSIEEISKMDLSKMDFRELFEEVMKKYKQPDHKILQERTSQKIQQNIQNIDQGIKTQKSKPGVLYEHKDGL